MQLQFRKYFTLRAKNKVDFKLQHVIRRNNSSSRCLENYMGCVVNVGYVGQIFTGVAWVKYIFAWVSFFTWVNIFCVS